MGTEEVVKLLQQTLDADMPEGYFQNHAHAFVYFAYYFAGMMVSSVLRLKGSDLQNERLYYSGGKNDENLPRINDVDDIPYAY